MTAAGVTGTPAHGEQGDRRGGTPMTAAGVTGTGHGTEVCR